MLIMEISGKYDKLEKLPKTTLYDIYFPKSFSFCLSLHMYIDLRM